METQQLNEDDQVWIVDPKSSFHGNTAKIALLNFDKKGRILTDKLGPFYPSQITTISPDEIPLTEQWKGETPEVKKAQEQRCRECGCTNHDCRQCIQRTGVPCHWVEDDLCSACKPEIKIILNTNPKGTGMSHYTGMSVYSEQGEQLEQPPIEPHVIDHNFNISQSFMKNWYDYKDGLMCGKQLYEEKFGGYNREPSEVMQAGIYFEYLVTGYVGRSGKIPALKKTKSEKMTKMYADIKKQAAKTISTLIHYGFEDLQFGETFQHEDLKVITDIRATKDGRTCVIDLKLSGLLYNAWSPTGWDYDTLQDKDKLMIQALHTNFIFQQKFEKDIEFYFLISSNKNAVDQEIFRINIHELAIARHAVAVSEFRKKVKLELMYKEGTGGGFIALPSLKRCAYCTAKDKGGVMLKDRCEFFTSVPLLKEINLG